MPNSGLMRRTVLCCLLATVAPFQRAAPTLCANNASPRSRAHCALGWNELATAGRSLALDWRELKAVVQRRHSRSRFCRAVKAYSGKVSLVDLVHNSFHNVCDDLAIRLALRGGGRGLWTELTGLDSLYESWRSEDEEIATSPDMGGNADISDEEFFDALYATLSECRTDTADEECQLLAHEAYDEMRSRGM